MKTLTIEELQNNYNKLIEFIENTFEGERKEKLLKLYEDYADRLIDAPASGKEHFHYAIPGGYILHIFHVIDFAEKLHNLWKENGAYTENYTLEELKFAALHHDLGKLGDEDNSYYVPNESEWHRNNQGLIFEHNKNLDFMTVPMRAVYILQKYGISMSKNELMGIMLSDGLYDESNKIYLISYRPENRQKTHIPYIIHQADLMATRIENDEWLYNTGIFSDIDTDEEEVVKKKVKKTKQQKQIESAFSDKENVEDIIKNLFNGK